MSVSPDGSNVYGANSSSNTVTVNAGVDAGPFSLGNFIDPTPAPVPVQALSQWR